MKIRKRLIVTLFTGIMTIVALVNMKNGDVTMANAEQEINYPYIENISNSNGILTITNPFNVEFQYSTNGLDWETNSNGTIQIEVNTGSKIYLISNFNSISNNTNPCKFSTNFDYSVGGNASYLLSNNDNNVIKSYRFASLFVNSTTLQSVSKNFLNNIQITSDSRSCYSNMFSGCANLINAPDLPSSSTASYCYSGMFKNCSSLIEMPQIGATSMMTSSCSSMFEGCENLTKAKPLFADNLNSSAVECYYAMFRNCISLKSAPKLLATNQSEVDQYKYMFQGCSSLCEIYVSYKGYFGGDISRNWVSSVAETGIFYYDGVDTTRGTSNIPTGWEIKPISEYVEKIDANDIAKEFNNNIDLYCKGGINPTLTGENSVSSTWATAAEQYSQLSDEEKAKFNEESGKTVSVKFNPLNDRLPDGKYYVHNPESYYRDINDVVSSGADLLEELRTTDIGAFIDSDGSIIFIDDYADWGDPYFIFDTTKVLNCTKLILVAKCSENSLNVKLYYTDGTNDCFEINDAYSDYAEIECEVDDSKILKQLIVWSPKRDDLYLNEIKLVFSGSTTSEEIVEMVSKYDYIYGKYGSTIGKDFLGRFSNYDPAAQGNKSKILNIKDINNSTWIIAVVSIIGLTSVGAYFFYRKRKEE